MVVQPQVSRPFATMNSLSTVTVELSQRFRFLFSSIAPGTVTIGNLP